MATKKQDPTITSETVGPAYPEGTHPPRPLSETTHAAVNKKYADNPDKPDPSSVSNIEILDGDEPGGN